MKFKEKIIAIREVIDKYVDDAEEGVFGYHGHLNIRPKYQRELVYDDEDQKAVIHSIRNNFPLNVMYWMKNNDNDFEIMDGQQRTLSICRYCTNEFSVEIDGNPKIFDNLTAEQQEQILKYKLHIYICEGTDEERIAWFKVINFKGKALTPQELLNAVYSGPWVTDAKRYFSKSGCAAYVIGNAYMYNKSAIRQEIFEQVLLWASNKDGLSLKEYMAIHQNDENALPLWNYFSDLIDWVENTFGCPDNYRPEMKKVDWGVLYNKYGHDNYNSDEIEAEVSKLMNDYEVTKKTGIYSYIFDRDKKNLSLRKFDEQTKRIVYNEQHHKCFICGEEKPFKDMHGDHWVPWSKGGTTVRENCRMLCTICNLRKSAQEV